MSPTSSAAPIISSAEGLLAAGDIGRCELVRGELIRMIPAGFEHGRITSRLAIQLGRFVAEEGLGETTAAETGFLIARDPDTVRAPDIAFVRRERLGQAPERGFFPGAPDLAVEVLSPDDNAGDTLAKVHDWLAGGAGHVWVVDPKRRTVGIYRGRGTEVTVESLGDRDDLVPGDLLPGFCLPVAAIFGRSG